MAAGLGFKTFTTGEVLTAGDVNGYLMQGVLVFASAAARNAAITSPQEGQFAFTKDTNGLWYYDGAAWVASGATGDIEGVTAGVGITGGGTSGTVTITNDMATTITASGDIVVGTGNGTYDNLPIGTTAQVLTADTTVSPYKVKCATPASSAQNFTLLSTTSTGGGGTTITVSSLSGYNQLLIYIDGVSTSAANPVYTFRVNADSTTKYMTNGTRFNGTTVYGQWIDNINSGTAFNLATGSGTAGSYTMAQILISGANSSGAKIMQSTSAVDTVATGYWGVNQGIYTGTSVISSFSILCSAGTFDGGTMYIYGAA